MAKGVFLDRDETLNPDPGYISDPENFSLYPWVGEELSRLKNAGFSLILVSNQSGIGRGLITWNQLDQIHDKLTSELISKYEVEFDLIEICPHTPDENCECRKPKPKLILNGLRKLELDPEESYMIGDRDSDFQAGINAGLKKSFLIQPGDETSFKAAVREILAASSKTSSN